MKDDYLDQSIHIIEAHAPDEISKHVRAYIKTYRRFGVLGDWERNAIVVIRQRIERDLQQGRRCPLPPPHLAPSPMTWGRQWHPHGEYGHDIPMHREHLATHVLICGNTNSGKTGEEQHLLYQLFTYAPEVKALILPNYKFREYFGFIGKYPDFYGVFADRSPTNIFWSPTKDPHKHASDTIDLLTRELGFSPGADKILNPILKQIFEDRGVARGGLPPSPPEVYERIKQMEYHPVNGDKIHPETRRSLLSTLADYLVEQPRAWLEYHTGWDPRAFAHFNATVDFGHIPEKSKKIFTFYLLYEELWTYIGLPARPLRHFIVLGDSQRFIVPTARGSSLSSLDELLTVVRACGVSICLDVQVPAGSRIMFDNMGTKIMCRLGSASTYNAYAPDLRLSSQELPLIQDHLKPGVCAVSVNGMRPFMVAYPKVNLPAVTEEMVEARFADFESQMNRLSPPVRDAWAKNWAPFKATHIRAAPVPEPAAMVAETTATNQDQETLAIDEQGLLRLIHEHPWASTDELRKAWGRNKQKMVDTRDQLIKDDYLVQETPLDAKPGRPRKCVRLTPKGRRALGLSDDEVV